MLHFMSRTRLDDDQSFSIRAGLIRVKAGAVQARQDERISTKDATP